ncbi:glycosyltransferase family 8 protein [Synechococcus sp. CS-1332]|uniref:glycosyltransferase family 8 protein n=1 Tax=Synechococcus sp. CS-1332 TaxID=2847972 RepID=UPI00223C1AEC|nr:glycosyltransferase family 8 protein [Synechococcus sp. CS-1332]MCT0208295.1 glycosyltransferase family 8 protein [Synechococcus sp. CS-1332]
MAFAVALCADQNVVSPTLATIYSLVFATRSKVEIYIVCSGWSSHDKSMILRILEEATGRAQAHFIDLDSTSIIERLRSFANGLHGNYMSWIRLFLPSLLPDLDRVLYLDTDLVVDADLQPLYSIDLHGQLLAAVEGGSVAHSLDGPFLLEHGISPSATYFNAGVLVIDLKGWRETRATERMLSFVEQKHSLPSHDQTLLNYFFSGSYAIFSSTYNHPLYTHSPPVDLRLEGQDRRVYHFVGSPKPWDAFGWLLHRNYLLYEQMHEQSVPKARQRLPPLPSSASIYRTWHIRMSYLRILFIYTKWLTLRLRKVFQGKA